ncbi:hypothetical protein [Bartonella sp. HY406]|uniref:hypothetical protein n=1 Tax=Bartonella sp. HY406 TaxID=2979331 RepID=UPI0021C8FE3D|nr:hypothetical protein [Bartonella sp. HY406]UXN03144.1 hypothetical protein N6B01_11860 [Bartonella sp. HY406]
MMEIDNHTAQTIMGYLRERWPNQILRIKIYEWCSTNLLLAISDDFQKHHICEFFSNDYCYSNCSVEWSFNTNSDFLKINLQNEFRPIPEFIFTALDGAQQLISCDNFYFNFDVVDYLGAKKPQKFDRLNKNYFSHYDPKTDLFDERKWGQRLD